jgi:hypothetical protein
MFRTLNFTRLSAFAIACLIACPAIAQTTQSSEVDADVTTTDVKSSVVKVMLTKDGSLEGVATIAKQDAKEAAKAAGVKVTLSADGKVVDSVQTDENGSFSFPSVEPGMYQILGASDGFVGAQSYEVAPFSASAVASPCSLGMCGASSEAIYDSYAAAPVSSFSTGSSCGCGAGGGGGGGGIGRRLGGGLLGNGRIGLIGLAGLAGLGGDDASPDR